MPDLPSGASSYLSAQYPASSVVQDLYCHLADGGTRSEKQCSV